ncbi:MAG: ATP synthase F1 subunit delta [Alphaproteobacteria bacterium]|nr:ATP synthase F1 subunit delta [Alphaproteobacteria bacterium]
MSDASTARRWARALVELATEAGTAEAVQAELTSVHEALTGEGGALFEALSSPVFTVVERKAVLADVVGRVGTGPLVTHFLGLLVERGRMGSLPDIVRQFVEMLDERAGRIRVSVATVEALSPALESELKAAFEKSTGKSVVLDAHIDPSLIGGLVARVGSKVYDASLRTRLEDLKNRLIYAQALPEA